MMFGIGMSVVVAGEYDIAETPMIDPFFLVVTLVFFFFFETH